MTREEFARQVELRQARIAVEQAAQDKEEIEKAAMEVSQGEAGSSEEKGRSNAGRTSASEGEMRVGPKGYHRPQGVGPNRPAGDAAGQRLPSVRGLFAHRPA